jgi:hypothetical protein
LDKTVYIDLNDNTLIVQLYKPTSMETILWNEMDKKTQQEKFGERKG